MIDKALQLATKAHKGQIDKGGNPYISHPIAVSMMMRSGDEKVVALLHDVVEDSDITFEMLEDYGFSNEIIDAIRSITKCNGEDYNDYITRVKQNPIARKVKIEDLKHNMDLSRISEPCEKDYKRIEKYKDILNKLSTC